MKTIIKKITLTLLSPILAACMILGTLSMFTTGCGDDGKDETAQQQAQPQDWDVNNDGTVIISFYPGAGVSKDQMDTAIGYVKMSYDSFATMAQQRAFRDKITDINIKSDNGMNKNGTVLTIGCNEDPYAILDCMEDIANGTYVDGTYTPSPKNQDTYISNLFGEGYSATVKGYLTETEWNGVADKIKAALNGRYESAGDIVQGIYRDIFNRGITIIVEKTTEFDNWKTVGDGKTMYLNLDALDELQSKLDAIILGSLRNNESTMAKAPVGNAIKNQLAGQTAKKQIQIAIASNYLAFNK